MTKDGKHWFQRFRDRLKGYLKNSSDKYENGTIAEEKPFIWCLVGNIKEAVFSKELGRNINGTQHFSPGTKVYCFPAQWGDGYEKIKVIGRHKVGKRYLCIVITSAIVTNWRLQKVYRPYVLKVMKNNFGWTDTEADKIRISEYIESMRLRETKKL